MDVDSIVQSIQQEKAGLGEMDKSMIRVQGDLPRIHMNESRVYQFFKNLLSNCFRYRREDLPLEILMSTGDGLIGYEVLSGHAVFFIRDNGVGIRPEDQNQIFTLFWHEAGAEEDKGTGVGLAIVKKIIETEGGWIRVESEPSKGAIFSSRFPGSFLT